MNASAHPISSVGDYAGPPPILIIASSEPAQRRAAEAIECGGFRSVPLSFDEAPARIAIQPAASAIWVEADENPGNHLDDLIEQLQADARSGRWPAVVSAPLGMVDALEPRIVEPGVELLIDANPSDRAIALAKLAGWTEAKNRGVNEEIPKEPSSARLRQLSDEVSRIAATLARLSTGPGVPATEKPEPVSGDAPAVSLDQVRQIIRARRLRARYFDEELFADPAWDMLLDLLQAEIAQHRVPVSSLCIAAAVPATTALRWIKSMTDAGLFKRRADPHDGRRVFVELAPPASQALRRYFKEVGKMAVV